MNILLTIVAVWVLVSVPFALLVGRILIAKERIADLELALVNDELE